MVKKGGGIISEPELVTLEKCDCGHSLYLLHSVSTECVQCDICIKECYKLKDLNNSKK